MNLALWILFGALVGWIASLMIGSLSSREAEIMTVLGVMGGIIGGWITNILCRQSINTFNIYSVLVAVLASALVIWFYGKRIFTNK